MKYIKLSLTVLIVIIAISLLVGYDCNIPIMLLLLAVSNVITAVEHYQKNKTESIILFLTALFVGVVSIVVMLS